MKQRLINANDLIDDIRKNSESYFADDFAHEWVDKQPTIEAIPVEWIEKQSNRIKMCAETVYDITYAKQLLKLIKQWRRENDDHKSG